MKRNVTYKMFYNPTHLYPLKLTFNSGLSPKETAMNIFTKTLIRLSIRFNSYNGKNFPSEKREAFDAILSHLKEDVTDSYESLFYYHFHVRSDTVLNVNRIDNDHHLSLFQIISRLNAEKVAKKMVAEAGYFPRVTMTQRHSPHNKPWEDVYTICEEFPCHGTGYFHHVRETDSNKMLCFFPHLEEALTSLGYMVITSQEGEALDLVKVNKGVLMEIDGFQEFIGVNNYHQNKLMDLLAKQPQLRKFTTDAKLLMQAFKQYQHQQLVKRETLFTKPGHEDRRLAAAGLL